MHTLDCLGAQVILVEEHTIGKGVNGGSSKKKHCPISKGER